MTDKKAIRLLKKSVRTPLSSEEIEYCREKGVLTSLPHVSHDEFIQEIKKVSETISFEKAIRAFLYSISTGDFRYRTALSSLIWAKSLPVHSCEREDKYGMIHRCTVCSLTLASERNDALPDMAALCRDRLAQDKRFMDTCAADYVLNDLLEFQKLPDVDFCDDDLAILNRMFGLAKEISPSNKVNALLKLITAEKNLSVTGNDAYSILGVLSSCGVFDTPEDKSYASGFVRSDDRGFIYENDIYYPLNLWRGKHGINYDAVEKFFGEITCGKLSPECAACGNVQREEPKIKPAQIKGMQYFTEGEYVIDLDDRKRYYYGLAPVDPAWDKVTTYSVIQLERKRMELYYEGNTIRKMIVDIKIGDNGFHEYIEADMDVPTNNRRLILPKTSRGREQTITPSRLLNGDYMKAHLDVYVHYEKYSFYPVLSWNCDNGRHLPIPIPDYALKDKTVFDRFTEEYIASCPENYSEVLDDYVNGKRKIVKYIPGDIFRVQLTPRLYTYALVLGSVRQISKWKEISEKHSFHHALWSPVIFRQYAIVTENPDMTVSELEKIPLLEMETAQDDYLYYGTHPVVASKKLSEDDIDLGFGVNKFMRLIEWNFVSIVFDDDDPIGIELFGEPDKNDPYRNTGKENEVIRFGACMSIIPENNGYKAGFIEPSEKSKKSDEWKKRIIQVMNLDEENPQDDLAVRYGCLTRKQFIELAEKRFKK